MHFSHIFFKDLLITNDQTRLPIKDFSQFPASYCGDIEKDRKYGPEKLDRNVRTFFNPLIRSF